MTSFLLIFALLGSQLGSPQELWFFPIAQGQILRAYRAPETPYGAGHRGIDIRANLDEEVVSPTSGSISFNGKVGYRNLITINSSYGTLTMEPVCSDLPVGEMVQPGSPIGWVCSPDPEYAWHCELCLHLGLKTEDGYLSPELYLGGLQPSRLLP